jgi:hypothetical protein
MLNWNAKKIQNLTGFEIWLFILGRVLVAFAIGVLVTQYFPRVATIIALPALAIGLVLFAIAARGLWRQNSSG